MGYLLLLITIVFGFISVSFWSTQLDLIQNRGLRVLARLSVLFLWPLGLVLGIIYLIALSVKGLFK